MRDNARVMTSKIFSQRGVAITTLWAVLSSGCLHSTVRVQNYFARIDDITERPGDYLSPAKGAKPLYVLRLTLFDSGPNGSAGSLDVLVQDLYAPQVYGMKGTLVSFGYAGSLPLGRILLFEQLHNYRVLQPEPIDRK